MKVLITGASGFVAEHLIPLLRNQGLVVIGIDRKPSPSTACDLYCSSDLNDIDLKDFCLHYTFDLIIHLAAARADWGISGKEFESDNINATKVVVTLAKMSGVKKLIFVSSISVFGQTKDTVLEEDNLPSPINTYGQTKLAAEEIVRSCGNQLETVIVRPTVIYGPSNPEKTGFYRATDNNIFRMIDAIEKNRFVIPGDRSVVKSVCYVENIAFFLMYLSQVKTQHKAFLFADVDQMSISEIAKVIISRLGINRKLVTVPQWILLPLAKIFDTVGAILNEFTH